MKSRLLFLSVVCLLAATPAFAQIENEIRSYVDSTELLVSNGKKMLEAKINVGDLQKSAEIFDYLSAFTADKPLSAFNYNEEIYLNAILGRWERLTEMLAGYSQFITRRSYYGTGQVAYSARQQMVDREATLRQDYMNSGLDGESLGVLDLLFHIVTAGADNKEYTTMLDEFNKNYPSGRYSEMIRNYLPGRWVRAAGSFSAGPGMIFSTGRLSETFKSGIAGNMSLDVLAGRVFASLYFQGGAMKIIRPFDITDGSQIITFSIDDKFNYIDGGLKAGILLVRGNRVNIAPYAAIGGASLISNLYDTGNDDNEFKAINTFFYGAGLHTEIKIKEIDYPTPYEVTKAYFSIKLEAGYNVMAKVKEDYFRGNIPYVSLAAVFGMGQF